MWQYKILTSGFFHADGGAVFGAIPKQAWSRKYPSLADNTCVVAMNCLLVWNQEKVILLDTGVGAKALGKLSHYRFYDVQDMAEMVRTQGFEAQQVTDVVLSHLHFDHCGGCTYVDADGNIRVTFPKARHWVGRSQWDNYLHPNALEKNSYRSSDFRPVYESGLLQTVESDCYELADGFRLYAYDGHSSGQLVSFFESEERMGIFAGDVIPTRAHFPCDWISAYDTYPLQSLHAKIRLKREMKGKPSRMFFYHDAYHSMYNLG